MKVRYLTIVIISFSLSLLGTSAYAVYGGQDVVGTERVVAIFENHGARIGGCSGGLLTPRIVITAAHCIGKPGKYPGVIKNEHWGYWVSQPGVDFTQDDTSTRVQSSYVVIADDYTNSYDPKTNDYQTTVNDIAYIFLSKPINISSYPKIANAEEVTILKTSRATISHFGYGLTDVGLQTGKPRRVELKIRPRERSYEINNIVPENFSIITDETGIAALCPGDSGGPWYAELNGNLLIVADTVGASGCRGTGSGAGGTFGTLVYQYESLLWQKWEYFVANEEEIKGWQAKAEAEAQAKVAAKSAALDKQISDSKKVGQYYQETTGCHANNLVGALQSNASGSWVDVAPALGWLKISTCPETNSNQPWTIYNPTKGEILRWRLQSPGQWEVFTNSFQENTSIFIEKAAAELKAKQEAEANAAIEAKAAADKAAADAAAKVARVKKLKSITCIKGKLSKKVTGVNPKCPAGYKKK